MHCSLARAFPPRLPGGSSIVRVLSELSCSVTKKLYRRLISRRILVFEKRAPRHSHDRFICQHAAALNCRHGPMRGTMEKDNTHCMICGKEAKYICNASGQDVCSVECRNKSLEMPDGWTAADVYSFRRQLEVGDVFKRS